MLYRLSGVNALIDRDSFEREWSNVGDAAEFAWDHPGEFGQAVINWEDLANGRYGEWLGILGPDAVVAVATAGTGTAATASTRAVRATDKVGDVAEAARDAGRSPYVSDSGVPPAIRTEILNKLGGELERYGAVIRDTGTPARGLEIITNEPRSVHTFESLMKRLGVPGHVVVREP
jgi:hypothetical protein